MFWAFIIIEILISIVIIGAVLMQASKGAGLASTFGGGQMGAVFGVRRTADFLQKLTIYFAVAFMVLSIAINLWMLPSGGATARHSVLEGVEPPQPGQLPQNMQEQSAPPQSAPSAQPK